MVAFDLGPFPDRPGYDRAVEQDHADPLSRHRDNYVHADPDLIYLDGNSLGRLPKATISLLRRAVEDEWGDRLIRAWNEGWWELQLRLGDKLAPLIGANPGEVIISDSTSVNLYKLAHAAIAASGPDRSVIVTDEMNFPTDVYVMEGVARALGGKVVVVPANHLSNPIDSVVDAIDGHTALVALSHTTFKSGYTYDMAAVTSAAHRAGAMVLWDCSHSVGALPVDLGSAGADLAVGCTYKYLNGGPGSPAFLYVREDLQERLDNPITAWWGHEEPFAFDLEFRPIAGIRRFHTGTMPTLSLAAIEPGLDEVIDAGLTAIRAKSLALSDFLIDLYEEALAPLGFTLATPTDHRHRGSHVSLGHDHAWPITKAMIERANVIPDFRTPDNVRLGLPPLYTSFVDIHTAVCRIADLVAGGAYEEFFGVTATVT